MTAQTPSRLHSCVTIFMLLSDYETAWHDAIRFALSNQCSFSGIQHSNCTLFILKSQPFNQFGFIYGFLDLWRLLEWCNSVCIFFLRKLARNTSMVSTVFTVAAIASVLETFVGASQLGVRLDARFSLLWSATASAKSDWIISGGLMSTPGFLVVCVNLMGPYWLRGTYDLDILMHTPGEPDVQWGESVHEMCISQSTRDLKQKSLSASVSTIMILVLANITCHLCLAIST